jgi:hypothetical protein
VYKTVPAISLPLQIFQIQKNVALINENKDDPPDGSNVLVHSMFAIHYQPLCLYVVKTGQNDNNW